VSYGHEEHAMKPWLKSCGEKIVESVYHASVYSVIAYSSALLLLAIIGAAVFMKLIVVPEFHPK
jgi:hypothetical protein